MTVQDVTKLVAMNKANYGYLYAKLSDSEIKDLIANWAAQLRDVPSEIGVKAFILAQRTSGDRPVSIGGMFGAIDQLRPQIDTAMLWHTMLRAAYRAANNYAGYNYTARTPDGRTPGAAFRQENKALWDSLPAEIREWAGDISTLIDLGRRDTGELQQFDRPRFEREIKETSARKRTADMLSGGYWKELQGGTYAAIGD